MKNKVFLTAISIVFVMVASFVMITGASDVVPSVDAADGEAEASITYTGESGEITETGTFSEIVEKAASYDSSKIVLTRSGTFSITGSSGSLWTVSNDVTLDLHGYELSVSGGLYAITVSENISFVLTDSVGTGKISASGNYYRVINGSVGSSITIDADISYDTTRTQIVEVVYVVGSASIFKMTGGSITLTGAIKGSSALNAFSGSFEITGGKITSQGTGTYAVNTSSYTNMDISDVSIVGIFNVPRACSVTISGGSFSVAPDFSKISIAEGKFATISESDGMSITDDVPSNPTASIGNVYYTDVEGRNDALAASVAVHKVTIYDAPENWTGTIYLPEMGDYVDVTMSNCATSASISVTTIDSCIVQISDLGNDTKRYTAMIVPASAGAMIEDTQVYYPSFDEAFDDIESGQTIVLLKDHTMSNALYVTEDMTLDLNGKTLVVVSNGSSSGITVGDCRLTITDSSEGYSLTVDETTNNVTYVGGKVVYNGEVNNGAIYSQSYSSEIVLDKGKLESTNARAISINGHVTINDFYISTKMDAIFITGRGMSYNPTTLSITGGVIESSYGMVISGNGTKSALGDYSNTAIEISGGLILATNTENFSVAIYHPQYGTLSITGGKILVENGAGIVMRSGDLNITGGKIVSGGTTSGSVGDAGNTVPPSAVVIDGSADYPGVEEGFITDITGGSFESDSGIPTITETKVFTEDESTVDITGGTFQSGGVVDSSIEDLINPVYTIDSETGEVSYDESKVVATVGDKFYASLADAIGSAAEGSTIKLFNDATTEPLKIEKGITLDLGQYTLTIRDDTSPVLSGGLYFVNVKAKIVGGTIIDERSKDDPSLDERYTIMTSMAGADLVIKGTVIQAYSPTSGYNDLVRIVNQSSVTLEDATLQEIGNQSGSSSTLSGVVILGNTWGTEDSVFNMVGTSRIEVSGYGITGNAGGSNDNTTINIYGGTIKTQRTTAILHTHVGTLNIYGGTIIGPTAVEMRAGELNISGDACLVATDETLVEINQGSGLSLGGVAVGLSQHSTNKDIIVDISGGTFIGVYAFYETDLFNDNDVDNINASISGGTFIGSTGSVFSENMARFITGGVFLKGTEDANQPDSSINETYLADNAGFDPDSGSVAETVEVVFDLPEGRDDVIVEVFKGTTVPSDEIPTAPSGYIYTFSAGGSVWDPTTKVDVDLTVTVVITLAAPTISCEVQYDYNLGATISVTASHPVASVFSYSATSPVGEPMTVTGNSVYTQLPGTHTISVTATDGSGLQTTATVEVQVSFENQAENETVVDIMPDETLATVVAGGLIFEFENLEHGNLGVAVYELEPSDIPEYGMPTISYNIIVAGSAWTEGNSITVSVPVDVPSGYRIMSDSVMVLYISSEGLDPVDMGAYIGSNGTSIEFETTHNSEYAVFYQLEAVPEDEPYVPFPDDDYSPLPPSIVFKDGDGSGNGAGVAACAVAVVVAVIMAILLATTYRRK